MIDQLAVLGLGAGVEAVYVAAKLCLQLGAKGVGTVSEIRIGKVHGTVKDGHDDLVFHVGPHHGRVKVGHVDRPVARRTGRAHALGSRIPVAPLQGPEVIDDAICLGHDARKGERLRRLCFGLLLGCLESFAIRCNQRLVSPIRHDVKLGDLVLHRIANGQLCRGGRDGLNAILFSKLRIVVGLGKGHARIVGQRSQDLLGRQAIRAHERERHLISRLGYQPISLRHTDCLPAYFHERFEVVHGELRLRGKRMVLVPK